MVSAEIYPEPYFHTEHFPRARLANQAVEIIIEKTCGGLAQLGERGTRIAEVGGSTPLSSTIICSANLPPKFLNCGRWCSGF